MIAEKILKLKTDELVIKPLADEELEQKIMREQDAHLKEAYGEMLAAARKNTKEHLWYTLWSIKLKDGAEVGSIAFMGEPKDGAVEIGYGINEAFCGKGYATQALCALCRFAFAGRRVFFITAQTEKENAASVRVLEKAGFVQYAKKGENLLFEKKRPEKNRFFLYVAAGLILGIIFVYVYGNVSYGLSMGVCIALCIGGLLEKSDNARLTKAKEAREIAKGKKKRDKNKVDEKDRALLLK